ncbi:unnamed protein product [Onchocerca flexuosa]|uniref:Ribosomal_L11_N domain-containing protein n=1 Tax=Onchocerca flexuosa TaxID=387005 RepID=A0A183HGV7_9BILA|nr:unnamed protein product [Onchocerca flexuosa]
MVPINHITTITAPNIPRALLPTSTKRTIQHYCLTAANNILQTSDSALINFGLQRYATGHKIVGVVLQNLKFVDVIFSQEKMSAVAKVGARVRKKPVIKIIHNPLYKAIVKAQMATAAPPLGPILGKRGINVANFCKDFNRATSNIKPGTLFFSFLFFSYLL